MPPLEIAFILGGAILTQSILGWPGIGLTYVGAIQGVPSPTVMAVVTAIRAGVVVMNIVAGALYGVLDPRVRYD